MSNVDVSPLIIFLWLGDYFWLSAYELLVPVPPAKNLPVNFFKRFRILDFENLGCFPIH